MIINIDVLLGFGGGLVFEEFLIREGGSVLVGVVEFFVFVDYS